MFLFVLAMAFEENILLYPIIILSLYPIIILSLHHKNNVLADKNDRYLNIVHTLLMKNLGSVSAY